MPFTLKDITANVYVLYIDNNGLVGLMGSANAGQAISFAGIGIVTSGAYMANGIAAPGSPSPLAGTLVIPVSSSSTVSYNVPQVPTVSSSTEPSGVTTTGTTFNNSSSASTLSVNYNIW